jgi:multiple sugar transport system permease protein
MNVQLRWQTGLVILFLLMAGCNPPLRAADTRVPVTLFWLWQGQSRGVSANDPLLQLMKKDPSIEVREWSGLTLPGGAGRTPLLMSIAGQTAPDLYYSWFHIIRSDISQGFVYPLNEWIGNDANGDGRIDPAEATQWPQWKDVPALSRHVATVDGKIYGIPTPTINYMGIIFRIDLVRQAGLDPAKPPKTWDEFLYWCQKLTDKERGTRGMAMPCYGFTWLSWLYSAGGCPVVQMKTSPTTGKRYEFPMEAVTCIAPDTGEDLSTQPSEWKAALNSEAAKRSVEFIHRLRWQKWIRDPQTKEPVNLKDEQVAAGKVTVDGRVITFTKDDVYTGCITSVGGPSSNVNPQEEMSKGKIAMLQWFFNDLSSYQKSAGINPDLLGVFPIPAAPGGRRVIQLQRHYAVMSEGVGRRPKAERDKVWKVLTSLTSPEAIDEQVRLQVLSGLARFVNPRELARLGYKDYIAEVPPSLRQLYADMDAGKIFTHTEPFMGFWVSMDAAINTTVLSLVTAESGEKFDFRAALDSVQNTANTGTMFKRNPEELKPFRMTAFLIFLVVAVLVIVFVSLIIKANLNAQIKTSTAKAGVYRAWMPWVLLFPALGLIALWGYYPLVRGLQMAFQDYHIIGKSPWVGLDNFIGIFLDPDFYITVRQTLKFVVLNLAFVFTAPILLSLLLSEIPKGKVFWRSVFFLPQLTSGLVVALLWKLMYSSSETGLLNQVAHLFGSQAKDWLGDPKLAMICTIVPSVWAGMGMASLIYLAALKGIPEELYEAADLDGAGMWAKLTRITLPQLAPLIIINFVGAFIGTFQSMGNIFLLTFGGPGKETMVMGMKIWLEAYANLQFSVATSMAWILGSALIGFAYLQIRILRQVEFRRVEEV